MSTSYTDVFTGKNITAAFPQYSAISLTSNITLSWPAQFQNTNDVVSVIMDITPDAGGRTVQLPDATEGSVGFAFTINNPSVYNFNVLTSDGMFLLTIEAQKANLIWLTGVSTAQGTWRNIPAFGGASAVTSINASSNSNNLVITGVPITTSGTIAFSLQRDLLALTGFIGTTGIAVRTAVDTWSLRSFLGTANQIISTNPSGIAGNPVFSLAPNISGVTSLTLAGLSFGVIAANTIATTGANVPLVLTPNGTGEITLSSDTRLDTGKKLKFTASGSPNYITFRAGATAVNQDIVWPTAAGGAGQVMVYDGAGSLQWGSVPSFPGASTLNAVARYSNITGSLKNSPNFIVTDAGAVTGLLSLEAGDVLIATIDSQTITTRTASQDLVVAPNGNGSIRARCDVRVESSGGFQRKLRLYNLAGDFYAGLQAVPGMAASFTWTMPAADASGTFSSDGAGNISITPVTSYFPNPSTLNAVPRFSNTIGYPLKNSLFVISDLGAGTGLISSTFGNIAVSTVANTIASTNANGNINLVPNGTGWVNLSNATASTSTATGAFVTAGGIGVALKAFIGGALNVTDATVSTSTITGSGIFSGGLGVAGKAFVGGALNVTDTTASTTTATGSGIFSGGLGVAGKAFIGGALNVTDATASTSTTTGSGIFSGGAGIAGKAFIGGALNVTDATASTSVSTGSGIFSGGLGIAGKAFIGGALNVTDTTDSTTVSTGSGIFSGGVGIAKAVTAGGNISLIKSGSTLSLQLYNSAATFYTGLQAGAAAANTTFTLPLAAPATLGIVKSSSAGVMTIDALGAVAGPLRSDAAGVITVNNFASLANAIAIYSDTVATFKNSGIFIDTNNNLSLGSTSIGTSGVNCITLSGSTAVTAMGNGFLSIGTRGTGTGNVIALFGGGDGGISASVTNTVNTKISVYVNGTRYYLLASTSGT